MEKLGIAIALLLIVVTVIGCDYAIISIWGMYSNTYEIKGKVVKTWIDPVDGGSAYLVKIQLEDGTLKMLEVKKNVWCFNGVNEDLVFSSIEVNKTYTFKCWGWDIMYWWVFALYWYPNVIEVKPT
jgi:hypothetical protein